MSELNVNQLKDYLKTVFDLEGALYQNQQLITEYTVLREKFVPQKPKKYLPTPPEKPAQPSTQSTPVENASFSAMFCVVMMWISLPGSLILFSAGSIFLGVIVLLSAVLMFFLYRSNKKSIEETEKRNEVENEIYARKKIEYHRALEAHMNEVAKNTKRFEDNMKAYTQRLAEYHRVTTEQQKKFHEIQETLQASLAKLYSQNIVYSKYRNLVAIATIYEYFDSGRCTELEGPNGAYNMYEGELRSNIIICSLSQIISDLGQIKNGQYALYEQLQRSSENVTHLLNNISSAQMLTAYYAEAAALAASADRITYGIIC